MIFLSFLEDRIRSAENLCIGSDFNFHMDNLKDKDATNYRKLLDSFDLSQFVQEFTHQNSHIFDLIIPRSADNIIENTFIQPTLISDHYWIHCSLIGSKPHAVQMEISFTKVKSISI